MMQAQIIPQYVNPPQNPQWASGSVKDTNGQRWSVPKTALGMFQQGQPANITYEQRTSKAGAPYNVITAVNGQPIGQNTFQRVGQAAPPMPQPKTNGAAEEIFITGVVGRAMGSGKFEVNDIPLLTKAAKQAWTERNQVQSGYPGEPPLPDSSYGDGPDDGWPGPDV